jgi:hypothetical protein
MTRGLRQSDGLDLFRGFFALIHWSLDPRVTPDKYNGFRVF